MYSKDFLDEVYYTVSTLIGNSNTDKKPYYTILTGMFSYGSSTLKELVLASDDVESDINELYLSLLTDSYELRSRGIDFVNFITAIKKTEKGKDLEIYKYIFKNKFLDSFYYNNKDFVNRTLNEFLTSASSKELDEYLPQIEQDCKFYTNYPVIILNNNIDNDAKIRLIKKTFIKKDMFKYIVFLKENTNDYNSLDTFIEAVVTTNNRIKEKDEAIREILLRFFIGTRTNPINLTYDNLTEKEHCKEFFDKYSKYFTSEFLNSQYETNRYWSSKNSNIKVIETYLLSSYDKLSDRIRYAANYTGCESIIQNIRERLTKGKRVFETDEPLEDDDIRALIEYDKKYEGTFFRFPIDKYYKIEERNKTLEYTTKLANKYPELFESLLKNIKPAYYSAFGAGGYYGWGDISDYTSDFDALEKLVLRNLNEENLEVVIEHFLNLDESIKDALLYNYRQTAVILEYFQYLVRNRPNFSDSIIQKIKVIAGYFNNPDIINEYFSAFSKKQNGWNDFSSDRRNKKGYTALTISEEILKTIKGLGRAYLDTTVADELDENIDGLISNIDLLYNLSSTL